ncbi:hypothetical protein [Pseudomonas sp. p50(2008)]|uniref:hypothetical protein n=1 Tax=Pseudomonas sp. p50(2008) TaxID=2816832 RepID=UPI001F3316BE|nr:hypothetical protein [Pseudomonas sp. p50(2008)]
MDLSSLFLAQNRRLFKLTMVLKSGGQAATSEIELAIDGSRYINGHMLSIGNNGSSGSNIALLSLWGSWLSLIAT